MLATSIDSACVNQQHVYNQIVPISFQCQSTVHIHVNLQSQHLALPSFSLSEHTMYVSQQKPKLMCINVSLHIHVSCAYLHCNVSLTPLYISRQHNGV